MMLDGIERAFAQVQSTLFERVIAPPLHALGMAGEMERAFDATELVLIGAVEVMLIATLLTLLERWRPVEVIQDARAIRVDVIYTLLQRLGVAPLVFFLLLAGPVDAIDGWLRMQGFVPFNLESLLPAALASPLGAFIAYLVVLDFVAYWLHRAQHRWDWWWSLHSLHHAQRQMTVWSDDRNHLLDDLLIDAVLALTALLIGVPPGQFVLLVMASRLIESLSHANLRLHFGHLGERLLVSPSFHRTHHAIGLGHEGPKRGVNFAVLFPIWDVLFGTADCTPRYPPTGVRDQLDGVDYGLGFWAQQRLGVVRLWRALRSQ
jgi:sterol desaturase/sphingolipid hydroxylase (fatty acid hydroxylase superfamily)